MKLTQAMKDYAVKHLGLKANASDDEFRKALGEAIVSGKLSSPDFEKLHAAADDVRQRVVEQVAEAVAARIGGAPVTSTRGYGAMNLLHGGGSPSANVGGVSTVKAVGVHKRTGQPILRDDGKPVCKSSDFDRLRAGVYFKWLASRAGLCHFGKSDERDLLEDHIFKAPWVGSFGEKDYARYDGKEVKTLIADTTSGGSYIIPEFLDTDLWLVPLLTGELYPFVDVKDIPYSNSVISGTVNSPAVTWNNSEGTALTLATTAGIIGQLTATIYPVQVSLEVGRDMLEDTPAALGDVLVESITQRFSAELDKVIGAGDGVNQPTGLSVASGLVAVNSENGSGGPPTVSDLEALIFGIGKQYRTPAMRAGFILSDTSYGRCRGIAVGPNDERRVLGMDEQSYQMLEYPAHVTTALTNNVAIFGALKAYRLWRRMGFAFEWVKGGMQLTQRNTVILNGRARVGGKPIDGNAFAKLTDWEA